MNAKVFKGIIGVLAVAVLGFVAYMLLTTPAIESLDAYDDVQLKKGNEAQIIKDCYPDPSFPRLKVVSEDESIVTVNSDKFTVKGVNEGKTTVICYDKDKELKRISITVTP